MSTLRCSYALCCTLLFACAHRGGGEVQTLPKLGPEACQSQQPAVTDGCTTAQRICLVVEELPQALAHPDFVDDASFAKSWQPRVRRWSEQLALLSPDPVVGMAAADLASSVDLISRSAKDRRQIALAPGLTLSATRTLAAAGEKAAAPQPLGCSAPADPTAAAQAAPAATAH